MSPRKADAPLTVQVPSPAQDRPSWGRAGIIAAVGFLIGVAWPRLAGIRPGPALPEASPSAPPAAATAADRGSGAAPAAPATTAPAAAVPSPTAAPASAAAADAPAQGSAASASAAPASAAAAAPEGAAAQGSSSVTPATPSIAVDHAVVLSCRTADGEALKASDCGKLQGLDAVIRPRLRKLADCPEAVDANGRIQLVVHLDLARAQLTVDVGHKSGSVPGDALLACARADLAGAALAAVTHDHPRYTVAYTATLSPGARAAPAAAGSPPAPVPAAAAPAAPAAPAAATPPPPAAAAGDPAGEETVTVVYDVALVRDAPSSKTGKIVARLPRGSSMHVGPAKDGWYPVKSADGFSGEGWVFRGAIGR